MRVARYVNGPGERAVLLALPWLASAVIACTRSRSGAGPQALALPLPLATCDRGQSSPNSTVRQVGHDRCGNRSLGGLLFVDPRRSLKFRGKATHG